MGLRLGLGLDWDLDSGQAIAGSGEHGHLDSAKVASQTMVGKDPGLVAGTSPTSSISQDNPVITK